MLHKLYIMWCRNFAYYYIFFCAGMFMWPHLGKIFGISASVSKVQVPFHCTLECWKFWLSSWNAAYDPTVWLVDSNVVLGPTTWWSRIMSFWDKYQLHVHIHKLSTLYKVFTNAFFPSFSHMTFLSLFKFLPSYTLMFFSVSLFLCVSVAFVQEKLKASHQQSETGGFWELHLCGRELAGQRKRHQLRQHPKQ